MRLEFLQLHQPHDGHAADSPHFFLRSEWSLTGGKRQVEVLAPYFRQKRQQTDMKSEHLILTSETWHQPGRQTRHWSSSNFSLSMLSSSSHCVEIVDSLYPDEIFIV